MYSTFTHIFAYVSQLRITPNTISQTALVSPVRIYYFHFTPNRKPICLDQHVIVLSTYSPLLQRRGALCIQRTIGYEPNHSQIYLDCCDSLPSGNSCIFLKVVVGSPFCGAIVTFWGLSQLSQPKTGLSQGSFQLLQKFPNFDSHFKQETSSFLSSLSSLIRSLVLFVSLFEYQRQIASSSIQVVLLIVYSRKTLYTQVLSETCFGQYTMTFQ